ncbi:MAG: putative sugar nucleotidyl transferase [Candidatus Aerophobetes bacterium]|nr:putative sugar nucleotidyl transferase [Candidatus Aerophobetes bacterium]
MNRILCIFEDKKVENFYPLTLTRTVYRLRCGITTLEEKISSISSQEEIYFICRKYLSGVISQKREKPKVNPLRDLNKSNLLFVNGRLLFLEERVDLEGKEELGVKRGEVVYARLNRKTLKKLSFDDPEKIEEVLAQAKQIVGVKEIEANLLEYPWDIIKWNSYALKKDFERKEERGLKGRMAKGAYLINPEKIYIGESSTIEPGVVLNAEEGPIYIAEEVKVSPPTVIEGPCYIGRGTIVDGAKIRQGCSVGPVCRIGGEIEESIFQSYVNKHHDGFIGHSYIGEWVNLGALTTTSDLKNTYGSVKVILKGKEVDTKQMKVGSFIGDHTKTGIGTLIDTGSVIGVASNIFGGGVTPKFIPSFSWGGGDGFVENRLDKVIEVARIVMQRRGVKQTEEDKNLLKKIYQLTRKER